ncbi:hypothetical protein Q3G72_020873 [Acer saccharum]|nr:hypothetical protein Q3G72_020873 [Acer saccharum]
MECSSTSPAFFNSLWLYAILGFLLCNWVHGIEYLNATADHNLMPYAFSRPPPLMVGFTFIHGAAAKGAVCLDGTLPGYHIHRGYGSGANNWLVMLEGGGWCNTIRVCVYSKKTRHGSSTYMEKKIPFTGILSNKAAENPDFFNWNRVKIRYCDGASFSGDSQIEAAQLYFRGKRIWSAAMEDLKSKGMRYAKQALLAGCSAGGLATILHCDEFHELFPMTTRVKCLSDAGLFLDVIDISGRRTSRNMFGSLVSLQKVWNLPQRCTKRLNPILCFFPQHSITSVKTPLFLLNTAYDSWQIQASLAPPSADPHGRWHECRNNFARCSASQIRFLQGGFIGLFTFTFTFVISNSYNLFVFSLSLSSEAGFRNQMLYAVRGLSKHKKNGIFINSCFAHCQSERQDTWFDQNSPRVRNKVCAVQLLVKNNR